MFVPLIFVVALFGQGAPAPSPFIGHWEGKITYSRPDDLWPKEIEITDLVINESLAVSGKFGRPSHDTSTRLGGDDARISSEGEFSRILLWIGKNPAFCHFRGSVELSRDGQMMTAKKFVVRHFGTGRGNTDDVDCPAKIELRRKPPGP